MVCNYVQGVEGRWWNILCFFPETLKERDHFECLWNRLKDVVKMDLKKYGVGCELDYSGWGWDFVMNSREVVWTSMCNKRWRISWLAELTVGFWRRSCGIIYILFIYYCAEILFVFWKWFSLNVLWDFRKLNFAKWHLVDSDCISGSVIIIIITASLPLLLLT